MPVRCVVVFEYTVTLKVDSVVASTVLLDFCVSLVCLAMYRHTYSRTVGVLVGPLRTHKPPPPWVTTTPPPPGEAADARTPRRAWLKADSRQPRRARLLAHVTDEHPAASDAHSIPEDP